MTSQINCAMSFGKGLLFSATLTYHSSIRKRKIEWCESALLFVSRETEREISSLDPPKIREGLI